MEKPYFSIIIPARTITPQIVNNLLPAIASQSFDRFEVYSILDKMGSTDNKLKKKYPWLHIIEAKKNKRPGIKRDLCVEKSKGNILVFIDDDVTLSKNWLKNAHRILETKKSIVALGGPGILPPNVNYWEQIIDAMLTTWLGSGQYTYRFKKQQARYVDDYPSMNLMIRKDIFLQAGGFDNGYWPGEDSKLLEKITKKSGGYVYYHPDVLVYHHRRNTLYEHLQQYKNYGKTRGLFAAQGDANSKHLIYRIPSVFLIYCFVGIIIFFLVPSMLNMAILPLLVYGGILSYIFLKTSISTESIAIGLGTVLIIPITHITYGLWYMIGYTKKIMKIFNL